jgi:hypothetical protein
VCVFGTDVCASRGAPLCVSSAPMCVPLGGATVDASKGHYCVCHSRVSPCVSIGGATVCLLGPPAVLISVGVVYTLFVRYILGQYC